MQERNPKDKRDDLEANEVVSFVNGSSSVVGYHRVVVEEEASGRPVCGLHERALNLATHDGQCFAVGTIPQFPSPFPAPYPFSRKSPRVAEKNAVIALAWPASHSTSAPPIF